MEDRILKIAQQLMNSLTATAPCTCGQESHAPDCAYELAVDAAWDHAVSQAEDIVQDVELRDAA